jgi:hypothetical protein
MLALTLAFAPGVAAPAVAAPTAPLDIPETSVAGERPIYPVEALDPRTGDIVVDGRLDEAVWKEAPTFTLDYETFPGDNVAAPVETEMWITYDEGNLYVAVRAHDPEPEKIRARLRDRDNAFQDDFVGVILDTFNDERRAFEFFVNPLGVQMDLVQNDVTGNEDHSWDTLWDSAGRVTETGYEVEMAIPFSSLRFTEGSGPKTWGIDALRVWPRDQRTRIGLNALPRGRNCYLCHASKLRGFAGVSPGRNLEITPTVTANDTAFRSGGGERFTGNDEQEAGITAHWGITPGTTLSGTVNPDFSQVEADAAQLDVNNQFALFFPEKRPFFLEGGDLFETRINAVYTRTIADPAWGGKVTGKQGRSAYGAIVAQDDRTNLVIPGSQGSRFASLELDNLSSVVRYRRDLASEGSAIGGVVTSRSGDGYHNHLAGVDSLIRWNGGDAFRFELLGSDTTYPEEIRGIAGQDDGDSIQGYASRIALQRQRPGWMAVGVYNDVSEDFRADLGFIPQAGYRTGFGMAEKYWYGEENGRWWNRLTAGVETTWTYDQDGEPLQNQVAPYFSIRGPRQSFVHTYLAFGPSWYQGEEFDRNFVVLYGEMQATPNVYVSLDSRVGEEIDYANARQGDILRLVPRARFDLGRHLRVNLSHNHESLDVDGGRLYTADLTDLRATYQINVRTFVRVVTQYFDLERDPALYTFETAQRSKDLFNQFLFSYKVNPQTVLFLGYSDKYEGFARSLDELDQTSRTLFLKVGYALVL